MTNDERIRNDALPRSPRPFSNGFVFGISRLIWLLPALGLAKDTNEPPAKNLVSFYHADLVCPAATQIGCGSAAKPILLELEREPHVREAWLSRAGTILAVVWKNSTAPKTRAAIIQSALGTPKPRLSGTGWYRGAAVDRLSEEEAGIIAARLITKIRELISIPSEKAKVLQHEFTNVIARRLTQNESREEAENDLMRICQVHLDEKAVAVLKDAQEKGAFSHLSGR